MSTPIIKINNLSIRYAEESDIKQILQFIKDLAEYEKMADEVVATEELLHEWIFVKKKAEVIIGELDGQPVTHAIFFHNFSTFLGRAGIYIEDIYVKPEHRGKGIGKLMLKQLAKITVERGCGRLEWLCLDWNKPSIDFYISIGAELLDDWTVFRVAGDTLIDLSKD